MTDCSGYRARARALQTFLCIVLSGCGRNPTDASDRLPVHALSHTGSPGQYVRVVDQDFYLGNSPFRFGGANAYWLARTVDVGPDPGLIDRTLRYLVHDLQMTAVRVWAFEEVTTIGSLSQLLDKAHFLGAKIILPLVNNWNHFGRHEEGTRVGLGGMDSIVKSCVLEGTPQTHMAFYQEPCPRRKYLDWLRTVVGAFRDHPAVFAWELTNEARCDTDYAPKLEGCSKDNAKDRETILAWARIMVDAIREIDPNHLVALGDEGDLSQAALSVKHGATAVAVDFATVHLYPDQQGGGSEKRRLEKGTDRLEKYFKEAKRGSYPVLVEEFGDGDEKARCTLYAAWLQAIQTNGGGGWLYWQPPYFGVGHDLRDQYTVDQGEEVERLLRHAAISYRIGAPMVSCEVTVPTGAIAHYPLDNGGLDASGNGYHGVAENLASTQGIVGGALLFNGSNARLVIPDALPLRLEGSSFTMAVWARLDAYGGFRDRPLLYKAEPDRSSLCDNCIAHGYQLWFGWANDLILSAPKKNGAVVADTPVPVIATWRHLAAVYNIESQTVRVYIDRQLVALQYQEVTSPPPLASVTSGPLYIGWSSNYGGSWFLGALDDLRIYNRALSQTEILALP